MAGPYTMSQLSTPSSAHTGVQYAGGNITISGTTTAGALIYLCQVPDGCTVLDWTLYINDTDRILGGANQKIVIGTSATNSGLGAFSLSSTNTLDPHIFTGSFSPRGNNDLMPAKVSLSADASTTKDSVWLTCKMEVAPSSSNSVVIAKFWCTYTMGGITGHTKIR